MGQLTFMCWIVLLILPMQAMGYEYVSEGPDQPSALKFLSPDGEVRNVVSPDFGNRIGGGDYGLANTQPIEVGPNVGQKRSIRIFRTLGRLRLSQRGFAQFQIKVGDIRTIYFWIESPPVGGSWHLQVISTDAEGFGDSVFDEDLLRDAQYFCWVSPRSILHFRVTSKEKKRDLNKRFTFTVSPVSISLWSGYRTVPYITERRVGQ